MMHGSMAHITVPGAPLWLLLAAALALALALAPLGTVMLWRRMAYFGDALSHAALFGVAISLAAALPPMPGILAVAVLVALLILRLRLRSGLAEDALLGTFAHGLLAAGLLLAFWLLDGDVDLERVLFGDMMAMGGAEAVVVMLGSAGVLALLSWLWPTLVLTAASEELAMAEGRPVRLALGLTIVAAAVMLALAARTTGVLLYTAMLVIPPAAARAFAREPWHMAAGGAAVGAFSAAAGLLLSHAWSVPSGAVIVSLAFAIFVVFHLVARLRA